MINLHHEAENMGIDTSRLPTHPQLGKFYRLPVIGKANSNRSASVRLLADGVAYLHNFITGESKTVFDDDLPTDPKAIAERKQAIRNAQRQVQRAVDKQHQERAILARSIWFDYSVSTNHNHPYLQKKRLKPVGIRQHGESLVIPIYSLKDYKIQSLQFIALNGDKIFLPKAKKKSGFFASRPFNRETDKRIIISEGWATSQSLVQQWRVQGYHVVAFDSGNLEAVAKAFRLRYPLIEIVIAGDNDHSTAIKLAKDKGIIYDPTNHDHARFNTGVYHAIEASKAVGGKVSIPQFTADELARFPKYSDWHDRFMLDQMQVKEVRYVD